MSWHPPSPSTSQFGRIIRRWFWLIVAVPLVAGLARLRFDADIFNLMPARLAAVRGLQLQQRNFADARELLVTLHGEDPEEVTEAARTIANRLGSQTNLVKAARWQPPWLERPQDGAENLAWLWLQQSPADFKALADRLAAPRVRAGLDATRQLLATSLDPQELARRSYDPLGLTILPGAVGVPAGFDSGSGIFSSADGSYRVVFLEPATDHMNYRATAAWIAAVKLAIQAAVAEMPKGKERVVVAYTGGPAFLAEISTGMESDLQSSVVTTIAVIAVLFWLAHRGWRPLGWLVVGLGLTLVITLALGGLIFGTLNVVSLGFAAVLLGLAVDYGLVSYQEFAANPNLPAAEIREEVAPGVFYSAATTAGTFLLLGLAGLPGLAELGVLTAVGLMVGAAVMLFIFLPVVARVPPSRPPPPAHVDRPQRRPQWWPTLAVAGFVITVLAWRGTPALTTSSEPLRPRQSAAYEAMDQLKSEFGQTNDPLWLVFVGTNQTAVADQLAAAQATLEKAQAAEEVSSYTLPTGFWPRPDHAVLNRPTAHALAQRAEEFMTEAREAGFSPDSMMLAKSVFDSWRGRVGADTAPWPDNPTARWLVSQFAARTPEGQWLALGIVQPGRRFSLGASNFGFPQGVLATSWDALGAALLGHVAPRVAMLTALIATMLLGCLFLAFRSWREVALSITALIFSFALLLAVMALLGWSWNLLSLIALPLLLGSSVDSTIHVQLSLRRHGSDLRALWRVTGKALLLCAGANIAGFGSLAFTNNAGLASLDLVCAVGVACVFGVCFGLLPLWWRVLVEAPSRRSSATPQPSAIRGALVWRTARGLVSLPPRGLLRALARIAAWGYSVARPSHLAVTTENLMPVVGGDRIAAKAAARENFARFAYKLVDLWRHEAGVPLPERVLPGEGWAHFASAKDSGRGLLLVTAHLGNWEFGAPLLAEHGVKLLVLTAPEPDTRLTTLRAAARARLGVDTLVVGSDPFAFIEVIKRLQSGGAVALLIDRPLVSTAAPVQFFGKPFQASIAAAELARASGCLILPVFIVEEKGAYRAHTLAPVAYERQELGDRAGRLALTGRIIRSFEPAVRRYSSQWFHFAPIWPKPGS